MLRKILTYAPAQIFSALSVFLMISIYTKTMDIESYGILSLFLLITEGIRTIAFQWVNTTLLRFYPSGINDKISIERQVISYFIYMLPVSLFISHVVFIFILNHGVIESLIFSVLMITKSFFTLNQELLRVKERKRDYILSSFCQSILSIILTILLFLISPNLENAALAIIISNIVSIVIFKNKFPKVSIEKSDLNIRMLQYGLPFVLTGIITSISSRVDRFFINGLIGIEDFAVFNAIASFSMGVFSLLFMAISLPLYPELVKCSGDRVKLAKEHSIYLSLILSITFPSLYLASSYYQEIISFVMTPSYSKAGYGVILCVIFSSFIVNFRAQFADQGLLFTFKSKYLPIISAFNVISNVLLLTYFVPLFGLLGAGYAIVISNSMTLVLSLIVGCYSGYRYPLPKDFGKVFLSLTIIVVIDKLYIDLFLNGNLFLVNLFILLAFYLISLLFLNFLNSRFLIFRLINERRV